MLKPLYAILIVFTVSACQSSIGIMPFALGGPSLKQVPSGPMPTGNMAFPPRGFVDFCAREVGACDEVAVAAKPVNLSRDRWLELNDVNDAVNHGFAFATDSDLYGKEDYWTYPKTAGDCEDFALEKQRRLIQRGWPAGSLLIAVAEVPREGGHAVLIATTLDGDYVLDILDASIRPWRDVDYRWIKRQSPINPKHWVKISA